MAKIYLRKVKSEFARGCKDHKDHSCYFENNMGKTIYGKYGCSICEMDESYIQITEEEYNQRVKLPKLKKPTIIKKG